MARSSARFTADLSKPSATLGLSDTKAVGVDLAIVDKFPAC